MSEKTTVGSLMKEWNKFVLSEEVSAFHVVPEAHHEEGAEEKAPIRVKKSEMAGAAGNAYSERRKTVDGLMTTTHKLMSALDKAQKKDSENWAYVGTAGELENKLSDINQMLGGI